jgi:hypothetical protein
MNLEKVHGHLTLNETAIRVSFFIYSYLSFAKSDFPANM